MPERNSAGEAASFAYTFEKGLLDEIERKGAYRRFAAGEKIIEAGGIIRSIPLVISGTIKISRPDNDDKELLLYYLTPGDSCAMMFTNCMQHNSSEVNAIAEDDAEVLLLPVGIMDEWLAKYPTWKSYVLHTIRARFAELLKAIDQIAFQNLDERLTAYLKDKAKAAGATLLNISHEHIAADLATSRVVVSRLLKKLENQNKVVLYRNQIKLLRDL